MYLSVLQISIIKITLTNDILEISYTIARKATSIVKGETEASREFPNVTEILHIQVKITPASFFLVVLDTV